MTGILARTVVGMGELAVSRNPGDQLATYALGSCVGVAVHDPVAGVGGLLHAMLPLVSFDPARGQRQPAAFVDTGVMHLFRACYQLGARKERMIVKVAGGAAANGDHDHFEIGKRNLVALRRLLWKNGVLIHGEDVGGVHTARTMVLNVGDGTVLLKANGGERLL